jgi:hypothetical protein
MTGSTAAATGGVLSARAWRLGEPDPAHVTVWIAPRRTHSSYGERMDFGVVVIFGGILIAGVALGTLLSVVRPRDDEAAAMHRHLARRALAWLPDRFQPDQVRVQPEQEGCTRRGRLRGCGSRRRARRRFDTSETG